MEATLSEQQVGLSQISPRFSHTFAAFREPGYRLLWPASVLASTGRFMQTILLAWFVLERTDSPWQVALVGFFAWAPLLGLGVVGGALADALDRRRLWRATVTVSMLTSAALTTLLLGHWIEVWHVFVGALVSGAADALGMPSRRSLLHDIVGGERVTNAVALDNMGMNLSGIVGPALAGLLITVSGVSGGYVVATAIYVVSLMLSQALRLKRGTRTASRAPKSGDVARGLKYVAGHRALLATVAITVVMNLTVTPYRQMVPVVARDVLNVAPGLMGLITSAHGVGALVGSLVVASSPGIRYHGRVYMGGSALALGSLLAFSLSRSYALSLVIVLLAGFGNAGFNTMQMSLAMLLPKDGMRGISLGAVSLGVGGGPVGMLITGAVATAVGTTGAIGINAVYGLVAIALVGSLAPTLRRRIAPDTPIQSQPKTKDVT